MPRNNADERREELDQQHQHQEQQQRRSHQQEQQQQRQQQPAPPPPLPQMGIPALPGLRLEDNILSEDFELVSFGPQATTHALDNVNTNAGRSTTMSPLSTFDFVSPTLVGTSGMNGWGVINDSLRSDNDTTQSHTHNQQQQQQNGSDNASPSAMLPPPQPSQHSVEADRLMRELSNMDMEPTPLAPAHKLNIVNNVTLPRFQQNFWHSNPHARLDLRGFVDFVGPAPSHDAPSYPTQPPQRHQCHHADTGNAVETKPTPSLSAAAPKLFDHAASASVPMETLSLMRAPDDSQEEEEEDRKPAASTAQPQTQALGQPNGAIKPSRRAEMELQSPSQSRFGMVQLRKWDNKYKELQQFAQVHGHAVVPLEYKINPTLAHWVKRQRAQYKKLMAGKRSSMTNERVLLLERIGFVWDSHRASWDGRWHELQEFQRLHGHSNVPCSHPANQALSIWVKCQRRQFRLYQQGRRSNMTEERVGRLESLGFVFSPRQLGGDENADTNANDDDGNNDNNSVSNSNVRVNSPRAVSGSNKESNNMNRRDEDDRNAGGNVDFDYFAV